MNVDRICEHCTSPLGYCACQEYEDSLNPDKGFWIVLEALIGISVLGLIAVIVVCAYLIKQGF